MNKDTLREEEIWDEEVPELEEEEVIEDIPDEEPSEEDDTLKEMEYRFQRLQADFTNFRNRTQAEKQQLGAFVKAEIITKLLPIVDNFERALESAQSEEAQNYVKGFAMIYESLVQTLHSLDVEEIKALGVEFDPNFHQAVLNGPDENYEDNQICQVLQKGYTVEGQVIRPAMVKVVAN